MTDPASFRLLPLGIGNAFTSRFYNSSFLLLPGERRVLVDAPAPLSRVLREATEKAGLAITLRDIEAVLITHLHADHCNGLEELAFWRRYLCDGERIRLYILPELVEPLWKHRLYASLGPAQHESKDPSTTLETYFDVHTISPGTPTDLGIPGLTVESHYTSHFIPCIGLRATYNGRTVGYSGDTAYSQELIDFLAPSDLVIHETGESNGHTPLQRLLELPEDLRNRTRLIHLADDFDVPGSPIPCLEEGRILTI